MNYRIRYRHDEGSQEDEVVVEANSPTEALIKFRCTQEPRPHTSSRERVITSVNMDEHPSCIPW